MSAESNTKEVLGFTVKKKKTQLEKRLTAAEAETLLASITPETHKRYWRRNKAVIQFILNTGLRVSEVAGLKLSDVLNVNGKVKILLDVRSEIAKRKKARQVPLNTTAQAAVRDLLLDRPEPGFNDSLVVTPKGRPLSVRMIQHLVTLSCLKAGILRLVGPHNLRHTCLSKLYEKTGNVKICQVVAGHSKASTTMDLYVHPTLDGISEAMKTLEESNNDDDNETPRSAG